MKLNFICNHLIKLISAFTILNMKLATSRQAYRIQPASQWRHQYPPAQYHPQFYQHKHDSKQGKEEFVANKVNGIKNDFYIRNKVTRYIPRHNYHHKHAHHFQIAEQTHYSNELNLRQLMELAKDPKNLRNGIYYDGAITYELGLPSYEIINPYDQAEVITCDHPLYRNHLDQIERTINYSGETTTTTTRASTTNISETTTEVTTTITTIEAAETTTSLLPEQTYRAIKGDMDPGTTDLGRTEISNNELDSETENARNNVLMKHKRTKHPRTKELKGNELPSTIIPVSASVKNDKLMSTSYGHSVTQTADSSSPQSTEVGIDIQDRS